MKGSENLEQLTRSLVKSRFSEYYKKNVSAVAPPRLMEQREFGFLLFTEGVMLRHRSFKQVSSLRRFIETANPSDVYYSAAYYMNPEAPMDKKGWVGSDLIFDIDADHINTECKKRHDRWSCIECGASGSGETPQNCPNCSGQKLREDAWMCHDCLEKAKDEVLRLIDLLNTDFGINLEKMTVNFSGNRGYHLHVDSEEVKSLGSEERKEIVDHITGTGLDIDLLGLHNLDGKLEVHSSPRPNEPSWRRRLYRMIEKMLLETDREALKRMGLRRRTIETLISLRSESDLTENRRLLGLVEGIGKQTWQSIIQKAVSLESVSIDTVVTTDIHRLIRLPETLNGKTGLRAMRVEIGGLPKFDPLREAIAFGNEETVHIKDAPRFMIGGEEYGPFKDVDENLPTAAAVLLLCKGKAHPVIKQVV